MTIIYYICIYKLEIIFIRIMAKQSGSHRVGARRSNQSGMSLVLIQEYIENKLDNIIINLYNEQGRTKTHTTYKYR